MLELPDLENPYKGLRPFTEADAADFFGRTMLIHDLLTRLAEPTNPSAPATVAGQGLTRFLAVVGPSGSGKSSVVKAGLLPALRQGGLPDSEHWFITEMTPDRNPLGELEAALLRVAVIPLENLQAQLRKDGRGLSKAVRCILPADQPVELLLVIDQFEEIFTLVEAESMRQHFLDSLVTAVLDPNSRLRVVITLRADFTHLPLQYVDFGELVRQRTEFVLPLTPDELEEAIIGPTKRAGLSLEPGMVPAIIRDIGDQTAMLPLLQYALTELFERRQGRLLTLAAYHESGGVLGALARRADEIYTGLDKSEQELVRQVFMRLVTLGEGTEDTKRRVLRSELTALAGDGELGRLSGDKAPDNSIPNLQSPISAIIDQYGRYRLLTFDHDPVTRSPTVEVAHESLLREWSRLRDWLDTSRTDIRLQRQLATAAGDWLETNQDESFLLRGTRLDQFAGWAVETRVALTQMERAFLDASLTARKTRQTEEEARRERELETARKLAETEHQRATEQAPSAERFRWLAVGLAVFLLVAVGAALLAWQQSQSAELQTRVATARELAAAALSNLEVDPERSILLALEAVKTTYEQDQTVLPEAEEMLHRATSASHLLHTLIGETGDSVWVSNVVYSPDGSRPVTNGTNTATIWDAATGRELLKVTHKSRYGIFGLVLSPDGTRLATAVDNDTESSTVKLWDAATGQELLTLAGHSDAVNGVSFSPDGMRLATASEDYTAKIWNTETGEELFTLAGHMEWVRDVAFSPDGTWLVTSSPDDTAKIWDAASGQELLTLAGHSDGVERAIFSPDGTRVITAGLDGLAKIWDTVTGEEILTLAGHTEGLNSIAFSADGKNLATGSADGTIRVWEATTGQQMHVVSGSTNGVEDVAFNSDGTRLITADWDNAVRIYVLPMEELMALAQARLTRSLTTAECQQYLHVETCPAEAGP